MVANQINNPANMTVIAKYQIAGFHFSNENNRLDSYKHPNFNPSHNPPP
jgi:hypothetical protein